MKIKAYGGALFSPETLQVAPDSAGYDVARPSDEFVLCRDRDGCPTAVYGWDVWDFNPYRTSENAESRWDFSTFPEAHREGAKRIMYQIIYFAGGGRMGRLGVTNLYQYFLTVRSVVNFGEEQKDSPLVGRLMFEDIITNQAYIEGYERWIGYDTSSKLTSTLPAIVKCLLSIDDEILGFRAVWLPIYEKLRKRKNRGKQHLPVPPRLYALLLDEIEQVVNFVYSHRDSIESFVSCFKDPAYGRLQSSQRSLHGITLTENGGFRPTMREAIQSHGLCDVFVGQLSVTSVWKLTQVLAKILWVAKIGVHFYTGMRDQEVARAKSDCLSQKPISSLIGSDSGPGGMVSILSSTTKFTGFKQSAAWLAPEGVSPCIEIARSISRGLAVIQDCDVKDSALMLSPACIAKTMTGPITNWNYTGQRYVFESTRVIQEDVDFLAAVHPGRDFVDDGVILGEFWPIKTHQFRRSLALYSASSGLVSFPAIKKQFKHLSLSMARYYGNGFENIASVFGHYDQEKGEYVLPKDHFIFEFQMAVPRAQADALVRDIMSEGRRLFGSAGSQMEKLRNGVKAGTVNIADIRENTNRQADNGEISYTKTILGGCTKLEDCDAFALGNFTECLGCESSVINPDNVVAAEAESRSEMALYEPGTVEYSILKEECEALADFTGSITSKAG
jgi:hypothetical protein